jgi:chitodextrinase
VPTEAPTGDNTATAPVTSFVATGVAEAVDLSWTTPGDTDFARTVIRFRTDGKFPVSPEDGFPAVDRAGAPGASESFTHSGLQVGTTYSYAAFAIDENGNVSDASTAEATPVPALQPPPAPTGLQVSPQ